MRTQQLLLALLLAAVVTGCSSSPCHRGSCARPAMVNSVPIAAPAAAPCPTCAPGAPAGAMPAPPGAVYPGGSAIPAPVPIAPTSQQGVFVPRL
jgi:hypothetical protein